MNHLLLAPPTEDHLMTELVFENEADALDYLRDRARSGTLFRGQTKRFQNRTWPPETTTQFARGTYQLDSIIPSDYRNVIGDGRNIEGLVADGLKDNPRVKLIASSQVTWARVAACKVAIEALAQRDANVGNWFESLIASSPGPRLADTLASLGQHVGLPTAYIDLTNNPEVAMWFACHTWDGTRQPEGQGVVYCFDENILKGSLSRFANASSPPVSDRGISDLRTVPVEVSPRPSAQQGFTAYDLYSASVLLDLIARDGVKAIVVHRDGLATLPPHDVIVGNNDPMERALRLVATDATLNNAWTSIYQDFCTQAKEAQLLDLTSNDHKRTVLGDLAPPATGVTP